jgi:sterol desaturase/sphingolipid hydroxylase (fatty acid hydroxylase superfamily)
LLTHLQHRKTYTLKDTAANVYLMLLNSAIDLGFRVIYLAILNYFYLRAWITIENVFSIGCLVLLEDFLYYWLHRFDHQVRLFWAVHVTHHSSRK